MRGIEACGSFVAGEAGLDQNFLSAGPWGLGQKYGSASLTGLHRPTFMSCEPRSSVKSGLLCFILQMSKVRHRGLEVMQLVRGGAWVGTWPQTCAQSHGPARGGVGTTGQ